MTKNGITGSGVKEIITPRNLFQREAFLNNFVSGWSNILLIIKFMKSRIIGEREMITAKTSIFIYFQYLSYLYKIQNTVQSKINQH